LRDLLQYGEVRIEQGFCFAIKDSPLQIERLRKIEQLARQHDRSDSPSRELGVVVISNPKVPEWRTVQSCLRSPEPSHTLWPCESGVRYASGCFACPSTRLIAAGRAIEQKIGKKLENLYQQFHSVVRRTILVSTESWAIIAQLSRFLAMPDSFCELLRRVRCGDIDAAVEHQARW
jgi:hypothetical protein